MTRLQRILLILGSALVFTSVLVALTVIFRDELRQVISEFLQGGWQDFTHAWLSLGAEFRWSIFIIILSALLLISLPSFQDSWQIPVTPPGESGAGRLAFWNIELQTLLDEGTVNRITIIELRRLALEVIGFRQQMNAANASAWLLERLEAGDADIPPAMRLLVDPGAFTQPANQAGGPTNLIQFIRMAINRSAEIPAAVPALTEGQLGYIINYLEQVLEGSNDHDNR